MWGETGNTSQDSIQKIILVIVFLCVPIMLLVKPIYEIYHHKNTHKHHKHHPVSSTEEDSSDGYTFGLNLDTQFLHKNKTTTKSIISKRPITWLPTKATGRCKKIWTFQGLTNPINRVKSSYTKWSKPSSSSLDVFPIQPLIFVYGPCPSHTPNSQRSSWKRLLWVLLNKVVTLPLFRYFF